MNKIFKPKRKIVKPRINEMAPCYERGQQVETTYLTRTIEQIQNLYASGDYKRFGKIPDSLSSEILLETTKKIRVGGYSCNAYFIVDDYGKVAFLTAYHEQEDTDLPYSPATQALIWRNQTVTFLSGISTEVIWGVLFPKHHALITDTSQSDSGKGVWRGLIRTVLQKNYDIYFIDRTKDSIIRANNLEKVQELFDSFYGNTMEYFDKVIAVCDPKYKIGD